MKRVILFLLVSFYAIQAWPTSVDQANNAFSQRRANIVKSWVAKYNLDQIGDGSDNGSNHDHIDDSTGFDYWAEGTDVRRLDPAGALRKMAAGFYVFSHPSEFSNTDFSRLSGILNTVTFDIHLARWQNKVVQYLQTIQQFKEVGTTVGSNHNFERYPEGDYDFLEKDLITMVYAFRDYPNVLTNQMIESIILQPYLARTVSGSVVGYNGSIAGKVITTGQDPTQFTTLRTSDGAPYFTNESDKFANLKATQPETENHTMMIMCWTYLAQNYLQWVAQLPAGHPRKSNLLTNAYNSDPGRYGNTDAFKDFILQMLGRFVNNGNFETSSKAYESFTISALQTFSSYAHVLFPNDTRAVSIHQAAENALNLLATQFAFQSIGGKRLGPMRRNFSYRDRFHPYANDYVPHIFGILSGAYNFDDGIYSDNISTTSQPTIPYRPYMYQNVGQEGAFALWSSLMDYRIPEVILDFMVNGTSGSWMRLNPYYLRGRRDYSDPGPLSSSFPFIKYLYGHYDMEYLWSTSLTPSNPELYDNTHRSAYPIYTNPDGNYLTINNRQSTDATFNESTQLYFVTPQFASVAGGSAQPYYDDESPILGIFSIQKDPLQTYDFLAKPTLILPRYDIGVNSDVGASSTNADGTINSSFYGLESLEQETITMRGEVTAEGWTEAIPCGTGSCTDTYIFHPTSYHSTSAKNSWVYKNFAYGYYHFSGKFQLPTSDRSDWPQKYPSSWTPAIPDFTIGHASFKIFDFRSENSATHPLAGNYLILNRMFKNNSSGIWFEYSRGLWEVVPGNMYGSVSALKDYISQVNLPSFYDLEERNDFQYVMATTGEHLVLDDAVGSSGANPNVIVSIKDATGTDIPLSTYLVDRSNNYTMAATGLMDVWEVDANYNFTGTKFVTTNAMGNITINNPRLGKSMVIDGSLYSNPSLTKHYAMPDAGSIKIASSVGGGLKMDSKGNIQRLWVEQGISNPIKLQYSGLDAFTIFAYGELGTSTNNQIIYRNNAPLTSAGLSFTNSLTGVTLQVQPDGTWSTPSFGDSYWN